MKKYLILSVILSGFLFLTGCKNLFSRPDVDSLEVKEETTKENNYFSSASEVKSEDEILPGENSYEKKKINYCYENLAQAEEKELYNMMKEKVYKISSEKNSDGTYAIESIKVEGALLDESVIKRVFKAFKYDNPGVFWLSKTIGFVKYEKDTVVNLRSVLSSEECRALQSELNLKLNEIVKSIPGGLSEYKREEYIHDYLVSNCSYKKGIISDSDWRVFSIVGALLDGTCVCEGYSKAMQILLNSVGVESRVICGSRINESHMWNLVSINNQWYHLDLTWDADSSSIGKYNYFNLSDEFIKKDHTIDTEFVSDFKPPQCSAMDENYIYKNSITISEFSDKTDDDMLKYLKSAINEGKNNLYILISDSLDFSFAVDELCKSTSSKFYEYLKQIISDKTLKNQIDTGGIYFLENKNFNGINVEINYLKN